MLDIVHERLIGQTQVQFAGGDSIRSATTQVAIVLNRRIELGEILSLVNTTGDRSGSSVAHRDVVRTTVAVYCAIAKLVTVAESA